MPHPACRVTGQRLRVPYLLIDLHTYEVAPV